LFARRSEPSAHSPPGQYRGSELSPRPPPVNDRFPNVRPKFRFPFPYSFFRPNHRFFPPFSSRDLPPSDRVTFFSLACSAMLTFGEILPPWSFLQRLIELISSQFDGVFGVLKFSGLRGDLTRPFFLLSLHRRLTPRLFPLVKRLLAGRLHELLSLSHPSAMTIRPSQHE